MRGTTDAGAGWGRFRGNESINGRCKFDEEPILGSEAWQEHSQRARPHCFLHGHSFFNSFFKLINSSFQSYIPLTFTFTDWIGLDYSWSVWLYISHRRKTARALNSNWLPTELIKHKKLENCSNRYLTIQFHFSRLVYLLQTQTNICHTPHPSEAKLIKHQNRDLY